MRYEQRAELPDGRHRRRRPRCANAGTEALSWLLRVDRSTGTITMGSARPSTDGRTFSFVSEAVTPSGCPDVVLDPIGIAPAMTTYSSDGAAVIARLPRLDLAIFEDAGSLVLPLREVQLGIPSFGAGGTCVGTFDKRLWCDGDSEGWTPGGTITAKITLEDADRVFIRAAGCQTLCRILVNDSAKTDDKRCKRVNGLVPEWGDTCVGGTSCKNAVTLDTTFASYGVDIVP